MFFGTRDYEKKDALNWGKEHNVEVVTSEEILSEDTVDQLEGFDGVTTMQFGKLSDSVYPKLEKYGIKQIAQRTAGFDMYDLDLAKKHNIDLHEDQTFVDRYIDETHIPYWYVSWIDKSKYSFRCITIDARNGHIVRDELSRGTK